jgi:hypothetical protein
VAPWFRKKKELEAIVNKGQLAGNSVTAIGHLTGVAIRISDNAASEGLKNLDVSSGNYL